MCLQRALTRDPRRADRRTAGSHRPASWPTGGTCDETCGVIDKRTAHGQNCVLRTERHMREAGTGHPAGCIPATCARMRAARTPGPPVFVPASPVVARIAVVLLVEPVLVVGVRDGEAHATVEVLEVQDIREHATRRASKIRLQSRRAEGGSGQAQISTWTLEIATRQSRGTPFPSSCTQLLRLGI